MKTQPRPACGCPDCIAEATIVLSTAKEVASKIEAAAVAEATRLCDNAFAGIARHIGAGRQMSPDQRARAKRYQIEEFRPTYAKALRLCSDAHPSWLFESREEWLGAVDLYCAAGIAEVERRFRAVS